MSSADHIVWYIHDIQNYDVVFGSRMLIVPHNPNTEFWKSGSSITVKLNAISSSSSANPEYPIFRKIHLIAVEHKHYSQLKDWIANQLKWESEWGRNFSSIAQAEAYIRNTYAMR
uniref:Uncharacterized protein n=1 Tax=Acrobeloides nanus TaxID=290746 RepID=A0A914DXI4_9BILA